MKRELIHTIIFVFMISISACTDEKPELIDKAFFSKSENSTVTDIDGNVYKTIVIGDQTWMAENLRVTHYADGAPISESFAPNNDNSLIEKYGRLYSFDVAMRGDSTYGSQGICPEGWHLPTYDEWEKMLNYVNKYGNYSELLRSFDGWTVKPGYKQSLFNAYPAGYNKDGIHYSLGQYAYFWIGELWTPSNKSILYILSADEAVQSKFYSWDKTNTYNMLSNVRLSVRCIKNKDDIKIPTVEIDSISTTTPKPIVYGRIKDNGKGHIKRVGICYGKSANINLRDTTVLSLNFNSGSAFTCELNTSEKNTQFYIRAFATNELGAGFSKEKKYLVTKVLPKVGNVSMTAITNTTASFTADITDDGGGTISQKGFCWSTTQNPTVLNSKVTNGTGSGQFSNTISGLTGSTTYYIRAYATNSVGTTYSEQALFITLPTINIGSASSITYKGAILSGIIPIQGDNRIIRYGICWGINTAPTVQNYSIDEVNLTGTNFSFILTNLIPSTKYYVRAWAKNENNDISYSSEINFTTASIKIPVVTINSISNLTYKSVTLSGSITTLGDAPIKEYGFYYSPTNVTPTVSDKFINSSNLSANSFSSDITKLTEKTKYYYRAYAITDYGTYYSNISNFTTIADPFTVSDGLLAFYNFNSQNCNDVLGKYNGIINGGVTFDISTPNSTGFAVQFNGTGYVNIPYQILPSSGSWSYSLWLKTANNKIGLLYSNNKFICINMYSSPNLKSYYSNYVEFNNDLSAILNNQWHHFVIIHDGSTVKYYIDNILYESKATISGNWGSTDNIRIGYFFNGFSSNYTSACSMDNNRIYNRALTTTEINTLYNARQ